MVEWMGEHCDACKWKQQEKEAGSAAKQYLDMFMRLLRHV
jgi:hypothetical protein